MSNAMDQNLKSTESSQLAFDLRSEYDLSADYTADGNLEVVRAVRHNLLDLTKQGYRGRLLRREAKKRTRSEFNITFWFLIARLVIELAPIIWRWWRDRHPDEQIAGLHSTA
jgi:hypothetical protein